MPLAARVSPAARRTIHSAFKDLEQTIAHNDSAEFAAMTLDKVVKAAHDIEDQLAARQLLRNMRRLTPLFDGLQHYSKSIEVACEGTPYMAWIWAPIKLILKISSDYVDAFDKIIGAYARIAEPLARFKILEKTYYENTELQQTFAIFYSDILKFHKQAYKFVRRSGWKVFFMTSWGRFERRFDGIIDSLKAHEKLVDATANAVGHSQMKRIRDDVEALRREASEKIDMEDSERTASQYVNLVCWLKIDNSQQATIFDAIAVEPQRYPETCDWILGESKVASWMRCSMESPFLVLHGHPGTGKSVLATRVVTFLKSSGNSLVISHICTDSQPASTEYDHILRSILLQLLQHDTNMIAYVYSEFIQKKKTVTAQAIESIVLEVIAAISDNPSQKKYVHIVLDGLDECDKEKQPKVVSLLERMVSKAFASASTVCKVLLLTRIPSSVAKKLKQKHVVSLSGEKVALSKAIGVYAAHRLRELQTRMEFSGSELKDLEVQLVKKADGMFLWARLVLNYLTNNLFVRRREVVDAVNTLPRELSDFYGQILAQIISHFDQRSVSRLKSILGWIAFARRPLRKAELRSALSFCPDSGSVSIDELAPNYLFDRCTPLIEERRDTTFAFIHVSVKEFLQSPESSIILDEPSLALEQGLVTAACLLSGMEAFQPASQKRDRYRRVVRGFHGLHIYASEYWIEYLIDIAASSTGLDESSAFFTRSEELSSALNSLRPAEQQEAEKKIADGRLHCLQSHPALYIAGRDITTERSERTSRDGKIKDNLVEITNLSTLLHNYQCTVRELLRQSKLPDVRVQELERFKQEFRFTAFTCRFWSCPLAGIGFESEALRDDHEYAHTSRLLCEIADCQYPPFSSISALKSHQAKHHTKEPPKFKIRTTPSPGMIPMPAGTRGQVAAHGKRIASGSVASSPKDFSPVAESIEDAGIELEGSQDSAAHAREQHPVSKITDANGDLLIPMPPVRYTRHGWSTVFNPNIPGHLDIGLLHTLDDKWFVQYTNVSSNGKYLAIGYQRAVEIYDIDSAMRVCHFPHGDTGVCSIHFSSHSNFLLLGDIEGVIRVYDILYSRLYGTYSYPQYSPSVLHLDVARYEDIGTSGHADGTIRVWNIPQGNVIKAVHTEVRICSVAISPNGKYVAAGLENGRIQIWDIESGGLIERLDGRNGHQGIVCCISFSPSGKGLVSGSIDKTVRMWALARPFGDNLAPGESHCFQTFTGHSDSVTTVAFTVDGTWVFAGSRDGVARFWDPISGTVKLKVLCNKQVTTNVVVRSASRYFATAMINSTIRIWAY